jgi:hypothetical protein
MSRQFEAVTNQIGTVAVLLGAKKTGCINEVRMVYNLRATTLFSAVEGRGSAAAGSYVGKSGRGNDRALLNFRLCPPVDPTAAAAPSSI